MKYNKRWEWRSYAEYRNIFRSSHRQRIGSSHVPDRFRKVMAVRVLNIKRRIINDWKRCFREIKDHDDWYRGDV